MGNATFGAGVVLDYATYLQSHVWRAKRNRRLMLAGYRCENCGSKHALEVHHRTYERLGREWDQDLAVLCKSCHGDETERQMRDGPARVRLYLRLAEIAWRETETIADASDRAKELCARHGIPYDGPAIHRAIHVVSRDWTPIPTSRTPVALVTLRGPLTDAEAETLLGELPESVGRVSPFADDFEAGRQQAAQWRQEWRTRHGCSDADDEVVTPQIGFRTMPPPRPRDYDPDPDRDRDKVEAARLRALAMGIEL